MEIHTTVWTIEIKKVKKNIYGIPKDVHLYVLDVYYCQVKGGVRNTDNKEKTHTK